MSEIERTGKRARFAGLADRPETTELIDKLLDSAPDAFVVVEAGGRIALVNLQTERMFGWTRDELVGLEIEVLIPARFRQAHHGHVKRFVSAPTVRPMGGNLELYALHRDGHEFPVEIALSPLSTEHGTLISASIRDISDRRRREREMRRLQAHLLAAVDSIQGAFAIFDAGDKLVTCNSECRVLLGQHVSGEIIGRSFEELLERNLAGGTFDLEGRAADAFRAAWLAYHRAPSGTLELRSADGRSLRVVERPTAESGTVMTIWDVTDDVRHEEELRSARAMAEAASAAKTEFLASMSHELRTPLNAVLGFAQLLQRDRKTPLTERQLERIGHVLKGGEHLLRLIDDVLDLARIEAGRVMVSSEPVSLSEVLADVQTTLDPMAARAEVKLHVLELDADLPKVIADRTRLRQVLMNYGSNAIKYGRKRGSATFRATRRDGMVRVSVRDDGIGIPAEQQDKVFQPFHRAGQETGSIEGTGIGLAITKRLAELMGGDVGFESRNGEGSEFWIELRAHAEEAASAQAATADGPRSPALWSGEGPRYLVVYIEDNPSNIAFMEDLMGDFDRVELLSAPTAEIGLELVRARKPDVVIMDINLPGMNGIEAAQRLRSWPETREIPVIALSAAAMVRDAKRVQEAGFHRFLTKPVKVDELTDTLEQLLSRQSSSSSS